MRSVQTGTPTVPPQPPLPFDAAIAYEQTVLRWADDRPEHILAIRDIPYGPSAQHRYDVFTTDALRDAPVLVFWHGGGWTNGYKEYVSFMAPLVTALGMVLVAPTYRLAPAHRLPAAFDDSTLLLATVQQDIARWGGDPARLYLAGHSAGGGIAAMTAMRQSALTAAGVAPACLRGCLPISGIMNLYHPSPVPGSLEERVYGMLLDAPESDAVMSPLTWSVGSKVPMVLSYGEHDSERVIRSNRSLFAMLRTQQDTVSCHEHAGEDHFGTHTALTDPGHPWYARLAQLVRETSQ